MQKDQQAMISKFKYFVGTLLFFLILIVISINVSSQDSHINKLYIVYNRSIDDTYVDSNSPSTSYCNSNWLIYGAESTYRKYIYFIINFSEFKSEIRQIKNLTIKLYANSSSGNNQASLVFCKNITNTCQLNYNNFSNALNDCYLYYIGNNLTSSGIGLKSFSINTIYEPSYLSEKNLSRWNYAPLSFEIIQLLHNNNIFALAIYGSPAYIQQYYSRESNLTIPYIPHITIIYDEGYKIDTLNIPLHVIEGDFVEFNVPILYNDTLIDDINLINVSINNSQPLNLNIKKEINSTHYNFKISFNVNPPNFSTSPEVVSNLTFTFNIKYKTGEETNLSYIKEIRIIELKLVFEYNSPPCNPGYTTFAFFQNVSNEKTLTLLQASNFSLEAKVSLFVDDDRAIYNYQNRKTFIGNAVSASYFELCVPTNLTLTNRTKIKATIFINSKDPNYISRNYIICSLINNQTASSNAIIFYTLPTNAYTKFYITLTDSNLKKLYDYPIKINKFFINYNNYRHVDGDITDMFGQAVVRLEEDKDYKVEVYNEKCDLVFLQSTRFTCKEVPCELTITLANVTNPFEILEHPEGFIYKFDYDKKTKILKFEWEDTKDKASIVEIEVFKKSIISSDEKIYNGMSTNKTGEFLINLSNYSRGNFRAIVYVFDKNNKETKIYHTIDISKSADVVGGEGLFFALLIILTLSLIGLWKPEVAAALTLVGLGFVWIMGLVSFTWIFLVCLAIIFIIIIVKSKTISPPT